MLIIYHLHFGKYTDLGNENFQKKVINYPFTDDEYQCSFIVRN